MMYSVAVIGAGPAGITAAIQLKRSGITPLILEKDRIGGLLLNANLIENYPGSVQGLSGQQLAGHFKRHLERLGVPVTSREVKRLEITKGKFGLVTEKEKFWAQTVIVASGTRPRPMGLKNEAHLIQVGTLYYEIKNLSQPRWTDTITIIGGGDAAFDYALKLAPQSHLINIIFRSTRPGCLALLEQRVKQIKHIKLFPATVLMAAESIEVNNEKSLRLTLKKGSKSSLIKSNWLLVAAGREPEISYLGSRAGSLEKIPGLFLAGDVKRGDFRQVGIAVGDGLLAAMQVIEYLKHE